MVKMKLGLFYLAKKNRLLRKLAPTQNKQKNGCLVQMFVNYLTYESNIYHKQKSKLLSLYSVRLAPGG